MLIDTTKESICINQLVEQKREVRAVEGDMIVPDIKPDVLSIIRSNGIICIYKKEVMDGKIKIDGTVQMHIIYTADDKANSIHSLNTNLDFSEIIQMTNANSEMNLILKTDINNMDTKILNGRKINIKCTVDFISKLYSNDNIDIINSVDGVENLQKLCSSVSTNSLIGKGCTKAFARETVLVTGEGEADSLAEILDIGLDITNKDIKISYNKVLVKADVCVKILYLSEEGNIKVFNTTIPAMGFIDIQNINDENICDVDFELKNFLIKPNVEENCSVYIEAEFDVGCYAFKEETVNMIEDLYSPTTKLCFKPKDIMIIENQTRKTDLCSVKEKISATELINHRIYDISSTPVILSQEIFQNQINYDGEIRINVLYSDVSNNFVNSKDFVVPFKYSSIVDGINNKVQIDTETNIAKQDFELTSDGFLDSRIDLDIFTNIYETKNVSIIDEIDIDEEYKKDEYSMVIYFIKPNDTLWSIAKRFGSTVDEITKVNEVEETDVLNIGKQLYIPRYCTRQSA